MKVIELLNKIANGEESDIITEFEFDKRIWNFYKLQDSEYCIDEWLLNQEIVITKHKEIIEEDKKIEKIELEDDGNTISLICKKKNEWTILNNVDVDICNKINEIIDYLEENK